MSADPDLDYDAGGDADTQSGWIAVWSIAAGTFLLVTSEFLPIGLLSRLATSLNVSEGTAGLAVTAPGFVAAIVAPLLAMMARDLDRRTIVIALTATIALSNLIAFLAPNFPIFLIARLILGIGIGGLWTFAVAVGRRLVPESSGARATSIISLGISAGTVCGMPIGAVVGDWIGWRPAFGANAIFGLSVVLLQFAFLPRLPAASAIDVRRLVAFASVPMARIGFLASGLAIGGHFLAYTFLEPYLRDALGLSNASVPLVLAGYAVAGIVGAFMGERFAVLDIRRAFAAGILVVGISAVLTIATVGTPAAAIAMVMVWGVAFGAVPVCLQIWMHTASPPLFEAGSALMVSSVQISLAAGAAIGGVLVDHSGIGSAFLVGGAVCLAGGLVPLLTRGYVPTAAPSAVSPGKADRTSRRI
jgi:predicted MFS family arabinose efflux permease